MPTPRRRRPLALVLSVVCLFSAAAGGTLQDSRAAPDAPITPIPRGWQERAADDVQRALDARIGARAVPVAATATWLSGEAVNLAAPGRVVVLLHWPTDRASSRQALDRFAEVSLPTAGGGSARAAEHPGVALVLLATSDDSPERVGRILERRPFAGAVVLEPAESPTAASFALTEPGMAAVIDAHGIVRHLNLTQRGLTEAVADLLADPIPAPTGATPTVADVAERLEEASERVRAIDQAASMADWSELERLIGAYWAVEPANAFERSRRLAGVNDPAIAVVGHALIARHGDADQVGRMARTLSGPTQRGARRLLVRSLGTKGPDAEGYITEFLEHQESETRMAAMQAAADTGDPRWVLRAAGALRQPPVAETSWSDDDNDRERMMFYGLLQALTGARPVTSAEAERALAELRARAGQAGAGPRQRDGQEPGATAPVDPLVQHYAAQRAARVENDIVRLGAGSFTRGVRLAAAELPEGESTARPIDPADGGGLLRRMEASVDDAISAARPVMGPMPMPLIRLTLCDDTFLIGEIGTSNFQGVAKGNRVIISQENINATALASVMRHEFVHILHGLAYPDQPRWLSEGLADSLSQSATGSSWPARIARMDAEFIELVRSGPASTLAAWEAGPTSGPREGMLYALAFLVVDHLRFGGYAAPAERLSFLMDAIDRGSSPRAALEAAYGVSIRELDGRVLEWVGVAP